MDATTARAVVLNDAGQLLIPATRRAAIWMLTRRVDGMYRMLLVTMTLQIHVGCHLSFVHTVLIGIGPLATGFLLNEAAPRQLLRMRKDELVRLYQLAGLTEDAEHLTKHEIVDSIVAVRDEVAPLPPSSPPGPLDSGSSDYSSDGGNVAGGEETDIGYRLRNGLRRRATVHDMARSLSRPEQERCYSYGELETQRLRARAVPQRKSSLQHPNRR